jgi:hypothetical protein
MNDNVESLFDAAHGPPESWMDILCRKNGTEEWLSRGNRQGVLDYATPDIRARFVERLSRDKFDGPQCWYKARVRNINYEWEQKTNGRRNVVESPRVIYRGEEGLCLSHRSDLWAAEGRVVTGFDDRGDRCGTLVYACSAEGDRRGVGEVVGEQVLEIEDVIRQHGEVVCQKLSIISDDGEKDMVMGVLRARGSKEENAKESKGHLAIWETPSPR